MKKINAVVIAVIFFALECSCHEVFLYNGEKIKCEIESISEGKLSILKEGASSKIVCADVASIDMFSLDTVLNQQSRTQSSDQVMIHLFNNDRLIADSFQLNEQESNARFFQQSCKIPKEMIKGILYLKKDEKRTELPKTTIQEDVVYLTHDSVSGLVKEITYDSLTITSAILGENKIEMYDKEKESRKVNAVTFNEVKPFEYVEFSEQLCRIFFSDHISVITGKLVSLDKEKIQIECLFGEKLYISTGLVERMDFIGGNAVYLSDMKPIEVKEVPFEGDPEDLSTLVVHYDNDKNCWGRPLQVNGVSYKKGLGLHSKAELIYDVPKGFSFFESVIGIDDEVGKKQLGSVEFIVFAEEKKAFNKVVKGGDNPEVIRISLESAGKLKIIADFAGDNGWSDWADFIEARFSK